MIDSSHLHGVFPAIPTPVDAHDAIDVAAARSLTQYLLEHGVNGIVPLGGTGEYGSLSHAQRVTMARVVAETAGGRVPVIPGVLDPGYYDALESGRELADAGADALMVLTPYYTNPTQAGLRDYFLRYADESPLPILIYEIPYRTRIAIKPEVLHELSRHERIIGMKACNTDMYHFLCTMAGLDDSFAMLSGEDTLFPLHVAAGARGGVVVTASVLPHVWLRIHALAAQGKVAEALAVHRQLIPLLNLAFAETNPGPLKSVMDLIGIDAPRVLQPLVSPAPELQAALRQELLRQFEHFGRAAR